LEEHPATKLHSDIAQFDHAIRQLWRGRDDKVDVELRFGRPLPGHLKIALDPIHRFGSPRPGRFPHPFELAFQELLALVLLHLLDGLPFRARQQVIGVIAFVTVKFPGRKLHHASRNAIKKVSVVRDKKAGSGIAGQEIFEPFDRAGIEVVCRFVEDEEIGTGEQRAAKRDPPFFSAGKTGDDSFGIRRMKIRDQTLDPVFEIPAVEVRNLIEQNSAPRAFRRRGLVFSDEVQNPLRARKNIGVNRRLLLQLEHLRHVTDNQIASLIQLARIRLHHSRRDLEERRFARPVAPDQTNAFALQNGNCRMIEDRLISKPHH
jgi:hypothetical protein